MVDKVYTGQYKWGPSQSAVPVLDVIVYCEGYTVKTKERK